MRTRTRRMLAAAMVVSAAAAVFFGFRSYGSFLLLRSAYETGHPQASSLRAWMTIEHVAATYRVPANELIERLALPPDTRRDESLKSIADKRGTSRFDMVRAAQRAVSAGVPMAGNGTQNSDEGLTGRVLSAVLAYGYPALAATFLFGAIGLPLPTGLTAVLAGSLSALGRIDWLWTVAIAVGASIAGDAVAYLIGRRVSQGFLDRHGRWIGYSAKRRARVDALFARWGGLTVLFSRTLVSHLSSLMSLLAGLSRYRWRSFLVYSLMGRLVWSAAYLGLGFAIGSNIEPASQFLANLSGLVAALAILAVSFVYRSGVLARG